jgi:hypothetical protein
MLGIREAVGLEEKQEFSQNICSLAKREEEVFLP